MQMSTRAIFLVMFTFCAVAAAHWERMEFEGVRPTSMGGAFIAVADDQNALWYNPAGLSQLGAMGFNLYDFTGGADSLGSINALRAGLLERQTSTTVSTGTEFSRVGFNPTFYMKNFAASLFYNFQSFSEIQNLNLNTVDLYGVSDLGIIGGYSYSIIPEITLGLSLKILQRSGIDTTQNTKQLLQKLNMKPEQFLADVYDATKSFSGTGWGIGSSFGALFTMPTSSRSSQWKFALTIDDIGGTHFKKMGTATQAPTTIPMSINFGTAGVYNIGRSTFTTSLDFWNLTGGLTGAKAFHVGGEWKIGIFSFDAGLYQGYPSGGFGLDFDFMKVNFSTYGVELGDGLLERSQRWYLLQIIVGMGGGKSQRASSTGASNW